MKEGGGGQIDPPTTFKKPSPIRVKRNTNNYILVFENCFVKKLLHKIVQTSQATLQSADTFNVCEKQS